MNGPRPPHRRHRSQRASQRHHHLESCVPLVRRLPPASSVGRRGALAPSEKRIGGVVLASGGLARCQAGPAPNVTGTLDLGAELQHRGEGILAPEQDAGEKDFF